MVWEACRQQARGRLDQLAQRIKPQTGWDGLVVPPALAEALHDLVAQVRYRTLVHETWKLGPEGSRGLGIAALFSGPSGTGKTLAAEVLARALDLDLYRIDLSAIVSKYIGETEKNLARIFDAAEAGGAVLLFDEADALFGKRSEVKDSHDRYANIEVGYLLQRMEAYRGLALLTTNLRDSLDRRSCAGCASCWISRFRMRRCGRSCGAGTADLVPQQDIVPAAWPGCCWPAGNPQRGAECRVPGRGRWRRAVPEHLLTAVRREYAKRAGP